VGWEEKSGLEITVMLVQFKDDRTVYSADYLEWQRHSWKPHGPASATMEKPLAGSGNGLLRVGKEPGPASGPFYIARAFARRGDIVMDIWFRAARPVSEKQAMSVAEQQLERL
jgi:hypothetical protein